MAEKTRRTTPQSADSFTEFEDYQLRSTMRDFLEEEDKKEESSIWNFATITGIAMLLVSMLYIIQLIGLPIASGLSELVTVLPAIGAVLVAFIGFGFFVGDRKRVKKALKKQKERRRDYFEKEFSSETFDEDEEIDLEQELFGEEKSKTKSRVGQGTFDSYALRQSKKLYKSRTDKKWSGVCGGLAKYFGVSSTMIRVLFIITFFAGSGATLLVYIALALALDKEPPEMMDDFNY